MQSNVTLELYGDAKMQLSFLLLVLSKNTSNPTLFSLGPLNAPLNIRILVYYHSCASVSQ